MSKDQDSTNFLRIKIALSNAYPAGCDEHDRTCALLGRMWDALYPDEVVTQGSDPMNITISLAGIVNDKSADIHARIRAAELLIGLMEISDE